MLYFVFRFFIRIFLRVFNRLKVEGLENLPKNDPIIIVANHSSYLDPLAVSCSIPRKIYWMVLEPIYRLWWLNWFFRGSSAFPAGIENWSIGSIRQALATLKGGKIVGIFPEGGRSFSGKLGQIKAGAACLSLKSGAPILPIGIQGAFESYPSQRLLPRPYPVKICIGKKLVIKPIKKYNKETVNSINDLIKSFIQELMEQKYM